MRARTRPTLATNARHALAADTRTKWPRPRHTFTGEADAGNGADNGTTPGDLAALTPRCAAGPDRWSMGNPAHTATQGVNMRIQGPRHPPKGLTCASKGPGTHPSGRSRHLSREPCRQACMRARTRPTPATNTRPALAADTRTQRPWPRHTFMDEADAGNERPPRTSRGHTHKVAQASSHFHRRGRRWQRGRQRNHPRRPGSINPSMRSWARQVEYGQPRPHCHPRG